MKSIDLRQTRCLATAALAVALTTLGCSGDPSCELSLDPRCANPIDRLVIPRLRTLGIEPREARADEFCRRMTIDLTGRIPTADELAACVALPDAGARVDAAMSSPRYERTMRRSWGEHLGYNNFSGWTEQIVDLDAMVGKLYAGDLRYDDFAIATAVHGGFLGLHRGDEWASALWRTFLGRPARADEIAGFRPLASVWQPRMFCESHVYGRSYQSALDEGLDAAAAKLQAEDVCLDLERAEWAVNFCACVAGENPTGCTTSALGIPITLKGSCADPSDPYADANVRRIDQRMPDGTTCADGVSRPECVDVETDFEAAGSHTLAPLPLIDEAGRGELGKIGGALVARGDFWEAAVDREARLLLGWWQTSFRHPDSDLPDVRRALADRLRTGGNVRDLQRVILTSVLYTAPAEAPAGLTSPIPDFAMAPTKLMAAETWLDSAALAVGEQTGVCDFRWVTPEGFYDASIVDSRYAEDTPRSIYDARLYNEAYYDLAIKLGGCNAEARRPSVSNVGMAFTESELTRTLCAYGRNVAPAGWDGADLDVAARHVVHTTLGRTLDDDEAIELVGEMKACITAGGSVGCADAATSVRWLCQRALDSTEFSTY